ncbi:MAG: hypothetical protein ACO3CS_14320, partial [Alphaproteobacteria bacterium]
MLDAVLARPAALLLVALELAQRRQQRPAAAVAQPQVAAPAQSEAALPPRLRERLERELEREESGGSPVRNVLIAVSVVATLGMMLILMQRFGAIDLPFLRGAAG